MNPEDIRNIEAEAGVIASVLLKPELTFFSEQLKPNYFTDTANAYIYYAVRELAQRGVQDADAYAIINLLNMRKGTEHVASDVNRIITPDALNELIHTASLIARSEPEDYRVVVEAVVSAAMRRHTFMKLRECERMCCMGDDADLGQKIYSSLDDVLMEFSAVTDLTQYKDIVDSMWEEIKSRQDGENPSIEFPFPLLNPYVTLEPGELVCFSGSAKSGKSAMLLTCTVDLLKKDKSVLVVDSEISTRLYTLRLLSHLTGVRFSDLRSGSYSAEDAQRIERAVAWLKTRRFIHLYMPTFDADAVYLAAKKARHLIGCEVIVVDYLKSTSEKDDAFATYAQMGRFTDTLKNKICGGIGLCGLTACQATSTGKIADSAKIARNVSTVISIMDKTEEEMEADGPMCGIKKLRVVFNRNGAQMMEGEYLDFDFIGSNCRYVQAAKQHAEIVPF